MTALRSFNEAAAIIEQNLLHAHFLGPASAETIAETEMLLGVSFPASYRAFLSRFGAGSFYGAEFYGVTDGKVAGQSVPSVGRTTLDDRKSDTYPKTFVTIMSTGHGPLICFDAAEGEEPQVVIWHAGVETGEVFEVVGESFGDFLLSEILQCISDVESDR